MISMGISGMQQVAGHAAEAGAARGRNNAKLKNFHRQNKEYDVLANLDNVQYLNDVQEQEIDQDATYQAMMDQWSDTDAQLKSIFAENDFAIEDAIVKMHQGGSSEQTGASAARASIGKDVMALGRAKTRSLHNKMFAVDEANRAKSKTHRAAKRDSHKLFNEVRFAPIHGFRPAAPELEAGPSKAGLILGLAGTGMKGFQNFQHNKGKPIGERRGQL